MRQAGKLLTLVLISSATIITVVSIFSFTATRFVGSGDSLQLDVEVKPDNVKLRAAVNSDEGATHQRQKKGSSPVKSKQIVE